MCVGDRSFRTIHVSTSPPHHPRKPQADGDRELRPVLLAAVVEADLRVDLVGVGLEPREPRPEHGDPLQEPQDRPEEPATLHARETDREGAENDQTGDHEVAGQGRQRVVRQRHRRARDQEEPLGEHVRVAIDPDRRERGAEAHRIAQQMGLDGLAADAREVVDGVPREVRREQRAEPRGTAPADDHPPSERECGLGARVQGHEKGKVRSDEAEVRHDRLPAHQGEPGSHGRQPRGEQGEPPRLRAPGNVARGRGGRGGKSHEGCRRVRP